MLIGFTQGMNHTTERRWQLVHSEDIYIEKVLARRDRRESKGEEVPIIFSLFVEKGARRRAICKPRGWKSSYWLGWSRVLPKSLKTRRVEGSKGRSPRDKYCILVQNRGLMR